LKLYVPKEVKLELFQLNRGIKVTGDTKKFSIAHVFNIIAADGLLLHSACKIRDDTFSKMRIFEVFEWLNIWLLPVAITHKDIIAILFRTILKPLVQKKRQFLLDSYNLGLREHVYDNDTAN